MSPLIKKYTGLASVAACTALVSASNSYAVMTSIIDFDALATDMTPLLTSTVTKAAGIGALILAAGMCWKFFRRFTKG